MSSRWNDKHIDKTDFLSKWSKDPSTKVGCVIVGPNNETRSEGYNGMPRKVNDNVVSRYERPDKYLWTEHAERNAIYNAARAGISIEGCSLYTSFFPCADCARAIIQSGILQVYTNLPAPPDLRWLDSFKVTVQMFMEVRMYVFLMNTKKGLFEEVALSKDGSWLANVREQYRQDNPVLSFPSQEALNE